MAGSRDFHHRLSDYIERSAAGNKSLAARHLGISRLQIHRYLAKATPRRERLQKLDAIITAGQAVRTNSGNVTENVSSLLEMIRYLERLIVDDLGGGKTSPES